MFAVFIGIDKAVAGFWYPPKGTEILHSDNTLEIAPSVYVVIGNRTEKVFEWPTRNKANAIAKVICEKRGPGAAWVHNLTPKEK